MEPRLDRVANSLEVDTVMRRDGRVEEREVARDGNRYRALITLSERGTSLDVGEQEDDGH